MPGNNSNTNFLYHANGDKTGAHPVTIKGTPALVDFNAEGNSIVNHSTSFNGVDGALSMADSPDWPDSSGAFTIEAIIYLPDGLTGNLPIYAHWITPASSGGSLVFMAYGSAHATHPRKLRLIVGTFGLNIDILTSNVFVHVAATFDGTDTYRLWHKGIDIGSGIQASNTQTLASPVYIGTFPSFAAFATGYVAVVAVHHAELYTTGFTPPKKISEMTNNANTELFIDFTEISQGEKPATFVDSSVGGGHTVTNLGGNVSGCTFWWSGAWQYDGSTDYHTSPGHVDFDVVGSDTQDVTIFGWDSLETHAVTSVLAGQYEDANNYWVVQNVDGTGIQFKLVSDAVADITVTGAEIADITMHHWAVIKITSSGPTVEYGIYVDGVQIGYVSSAVTDTLAGSLQLGALAPSNYMDGFKGEFGIYFGNLYSASPNSTPDDSFTPPTAKATNDANMKLHISPEGNSAIGSTEAHSMEFTDGIVLSQESDTGFGQSTLLDGSGDWIEESNPADFIQT